MKQKFIEALRVGQKVNHSIYGVCTVEGYIQDKGIELTPDSREGLELLANNTKKPIRMAFTESQFLKKKLIKFLVYQNLVKEERLRSFDLNTVQRFVEAENEREAINKFIAATGHLPCIRKFAPVAINQDLITVL